MRTFLFSVLLFSISFFQSNAQAPQVVSVFPTAQTIDAEAQAEIVIDFDVPIDPTSITAQTVKVFGRWFGPSTGLISITNDDKQVRFFPTEPFFAGEWVTVSLTEGVKSATGEILEPCYAWNFWIKTAPGKLEQELVETIELRVGNEGTLQTYGAYAGDMNNDGFSDLVAVNESSDDLRIMMNDGTGRYDDFVLYDFGANSTPSPSEGADFNGDGEIDIVVTTAWDNEVRVMMGDGEGNFSSLETYYTSNGVRGVVVGDFNGDGWDDMLTTNRLDGDVSIFINDGDGTFTESNMDLPGVDENACSMTDANGDGVLDVFYGTYQSQHIGILLGDGDGNFIPSEQMSVQGRPWMVGAADFNGDGHADMAAVLTQTNRVAVAFGDGTGSLSDPVYYNPSNFNFPVAIDLGDIDGDGDLDMATSCYSSSTYTIFENDGNGQFTEALNLTAPGASSCVILHDRDNDGDLDITGTDEVDDLVLLFENADSTVSSNVELKKEGFDMTISPNPVIDNINIKVTAVQSEEVVFEIFDLEGKRVMGWKKEILNGLNVESKFLEKSLPAGSYILRITGGQKQTSRMFVSE